MRRIGARLGGKRCQAQSQAEKNKAFGQVSHLEKPLIGVGRTMMAEDVGAGWLTAESVGIGVIAVDRRRVSGVWRGLIGRGRLGTGARVSRQREQSDGQSQSRQEFRSNKHLRDLSG